MKLQITLHPYGHTKTKEICAARGITMTELMHSLMRQAVNAAIEGKEEFTVKLPAKVVKTCFACEARFTPKRGWSNLCPDCRRPARKKEDSMEF